MLFFKSSASLKKAKDESKHSENWHPLQRNEQETDLPAILKITDVWRDITLAVISDPMFTLETPPRQQFAK